MSMAKGLHLMGDGQVLVEYDKRRRGPISRAQYKANGYKPACDRLPAEAPPKVLTHVATDVFDKAFPNRHGGEFFLKPMLRGFRPDG
jgi:hypothetical protein